MLQSKTADNFPQRFEVRIGGFFGPSYQVTWRPNRTLVYQVRRAGAGAQPPAVTTITPSARQWQQFWKTMDAVGLWQWRAGYRNDSVADGTQWSLEIAHANKRVKSSGSNDYPRGAGDARRLPSDPEPSQTFARFLSAVESLLGGKPFR